MWRSICIFVLCLTSYIHAEDVRLDNLDPPEAQQIIDSKDTSLKYAPKVASNVPAVRYLGNEPHHVQEDIYLANQYHGQDGVGGYLYGYSVPDIAKTERKKAGGDLRGAYNYIAGDGQEIKVEYWDDGTGFHQVDNVPKILPTQIPDLPEVQAAKDEHARIWAEQAERNSKPIQNPFPNAQPGAYAGFGAGVGAGQPNLKPQGQYNQGQYNPNQQQQQPYGQQRPQAGYQPQQGLGYQRPGQQGQHQGQGQGQYGNQPQNQGYGQQNQPRPQQPYGGQQSQGHGFNKPAQGYGQQGGSGQYAGQQSQTKNQYVNPNQQDGEDDGAYRSNDDEGQWKDDGPTGPPKGFFYNVDYPVGIIVSKQGGAQHGASLSDTYDKNKASFQQQLQGGAAVHGGGTYPSYQVHS